jgi:PIN domain nuclease of toxin-antitoxin system
MRVLLDTHMLLWYHAADKDLPKYANAIIRSEENQCYVSIVSLWEISVKHSLGKLPLRVPLREFIALIHAAGFRSLELLSEHVITAATLPLHHRDPFDRMLIAQAKA